MYTVITGNDRSDLLAMADEVTIPGWPAFMHRDPAGKDWPKLYDRFAGFQFVLSDPKTGETMAVGNSVPLAWSQPFVDLPDGGWRWALKRGIEDGENGSAPTVLCALAVTTPEQHRGKGVSAHAVRTMRATAKASGFEHLIVPARPSLKCRYPLTPMERYIRWRTEEGLPFDPWLRVHVRLGAEVIRVCSRSMQITGTVAEWEAWTGMAFPESGSYILPEALVPVEIDCEADRGLYIEPNVWVRHTCTSDL